MTDRTVVAIAGDETPSDDHQSVVTEFRAELEHTGTPIAQAAREIGRGAGQATLSTWMRGEYQGDVAGVTKRVRRWLETRRSAAEHDTSGLHIDRHVDLGVTARIEDALTVAQARGDVTAIYGPSGAGKTAALEHYCAERAGAFYVLVSPGFRSIAGLVSEVAEAIGEGAEHKSTRLAEKAVVKRLTDRRAMLVIDECQHLLPRLLDELRYLRDAAKCGLALVGDEDLKTLLYGAATRRGPIIGRIGTRLELKPPSRDDVRRLGESVLARAPGDDELDILLGTARSDGGMHAMRRLLVRAWDYARAGGRTAIDADDLALAAKGVAS